MVYDMGKILTILLLLVTIPLGSIGQSKTRITDTTGYYQFSIDYWFNMHHFLWQESFMNTSLDSTVILDKLPKPAQKQLFKALNYYKENLADEDLRMSDYMTSFKEWITLEDPFENPIPDQFRSHFQVLQAFENTYDQ